MATRMLGIEITVTADSDDDLETVADGIADALEGLAGVEEFEIFELTDDEDDDEDDDLGL